MPIYEYGCNCGNRLEVIQAIGAISPVCPSCEEAMAKMPTCQALVYMKGCPSFRKRYLGSAPYTTRTTSSEVVKGGPGAKDPRAIMEGDKWLEGLE